MRNNGLGGTPKAASVPRLPGFRDRVSGRTLTEPDELIRANENAQNRMRSRLTSRRSVSADPWMFRRPRRRRSVPSTADTNVGGHLDGERRRLTIGPGFPECLISFSQSI
jgi:hypothetical protein